MAVSATTKRATRHLTPRVKLPSESVLAKLVPENRPLLQKAVVELAEYVVHPIFQNRNAEKLFFDGSDTSDSCGPVRSPSALSHFGDDDEAKPRAKLLTFSPQQEQHAFKRFNYARYRVFKILWAYRGRRLTLSAARQLVAWQRRAFQTRADIVQANVPLVLAMAKRSRLASVDFAELISEGNMALLRSVDKFDCSRGFKFSTYACRAILKSFSRVAMRAARHRGYFPTEFDPALEKSNYVEKRREELETDSVDDLRRIIARNTANLNEIEQRVLRARFALGTPSSEQPDPMTLEEVGQIIGVTKERVRQIQNKALEKLRKCFEDSVLAA